MAVDESNYMRVHLYISAPAHTNSTRFTSESDVHSSLSSEALDANSGHIHDTKNFEGLQALN